MAQQFTGLPMEDLIGGPLNASAKANAAMALTQYCSSVRHTSYAPVMIEMSLERGVLTPTTDKDGKPTTEIRNFTTSFNLPLLTIIPVNSLGVNNVDISFEMEVKSSFSETESIGVNTIIEAFTQAIQPIEMPAEKGDEKDTK